MKKEKLYSKIKSASLYLKVAFFFILLSFGSKTLAKKIKLKSLGNINHVSFYGNADQSIKVIKRKQSPPLKNLKLNKKLLREMANVRFQSLNLLKLGFHSFNVIHVYEKPVTLSKGQKAYAWSGSYKDKEGKSHLFKEFISMGITWNVYVSKKEDLKLGEQAIKEALRM